MNNLPPLPLVDGCLFIDNSFLDLLACPRKLQYSALAKRIPVSDNPALNFGTAVHLALECRYKNINKTIFEIEDLQSELLTNHFLAHPQPDGDHRDLNHCMELVRRYNALYLVEPFNIMSDKDGKPMVELSFALPIFEYVSRTPIHSVQGGLSGHSCGPDDLFYNIKVVYTGRIDLPVSWDGHLFILDHKTTSQLGPTFFDQHRMSAQQIGYCWAFEQLTQQRVAGFAVNAIRTLAPTKKMIDGVESKANIEKWWSASFFREREYIQQWRVDEWKTNTISLIEEFLWNYQRGYLPMKTKQCTHFGKCPYFDVCYLPPEQRETLLYSTQFQHNEWTPLK